MGNNIEYVCKKENGECTYWSALHGLADYHEEKYKNCSHCTSPARLEAYKNHWGERSK